MLRLTPPSFLYSFCYRILTSFDCKNSTRFAQWEQLDGSKTFIKKSDVFPAQMAHYENLLLPIPKNYESYLTQHYGNWMKVPNYEDIQWDQHAELWDVNSDFRIYLSHIKNFSDENRL